MGETGRVRICLLIITYNHVCQQGRYQQGNGHYDP